MTSAAAVNGKEFLMSRTWIRNASLLAAAATGAAGVLGIDIASGLRTPAQGASSVTSVTSTAPGLSTRGTVKARTIENARLAQQRAEAAQRAASSGLPNVVPLQLVRVAANVPRRPLVRALSGDSWQPTTDGPRHSSPASTRCGPTSRAGRCTRRTQAAPTESRRHCLARACRRLAATGAPVPRRRSAGDFDYIDARYGSPCGALQHWRSHRWY